MAGYPAGSLVVNDLAFDPSYQYTATTTRGANWEPFWRYRWAGDLFDHLAISTPSDDYQPGFPMQGEFNPTPTPRKAKAEAAKKPDQPAPTPTRKD